MQKYIRKGNFTNTFLMDEKRDLWQNIRLCMLLDFYFISISLTKEHLNYKLKP